ncbi:MAG: DUF2284 domain-containing protein [Oscillospiraceae bacterium]|nr:DUF2284 domain-containing protein [Oscillospiraceae bacterium]
MDQELLIRQLCGLPVVQYEFFETACLTFSSRVRYICQTECPQYGKSWACPPGVGTVEACQERCLSYPHALLFTTMTEVDDIADIEATLATRSEHEAVTHQINRLMRGQGADTYPLSTESCAVCPECTCPDAPCRHPERMFPCVESHGILVTEIAERLGIDFQAGGNTVTWFSLILYR